MFSNIELCCALCYFKNLHFGHKLLDINDIDSLIKENISIEESNKKYNLEIEKINNLKEKIEKEINKIDKLYNNVYK